MEKPEILGAPPKRTPMRERGLKQNIGSDDVGVDEFGRPIDRSVDVTFRRQMHDRLGFKTRENVSNSRTIADIGAAEMIPRMALDRSERSKIARVGQFIDHQHLVIGVSDKMS